jgi:NADP-dependent 3-hydroxy acid dehydrogenase YdfG
MQNLNLNLENEFFGKRIIVTGASRGLGAVTCEALAKRGAKIAMLARSKKDIDSLRKKFKNPFDHISIKTDLLKSSEIKLAIKKAKNFLKEIDIVLHIAGGGFGLKEVLINDDDLDKLFQVNLRSAIEINRLIVKGKKKKTKSQNYSCWFNSIQRSDWFSGIQYSKICISCICKKCGQRTL